MNVTDDGCAFTIVTRYEGRAYLKSMTSGGVLSSDRGSGDYGGECRSTRWTDATRRYTPGWVA